MLPPRYRLDGPGSRADAAALFRAQLASSPRAPVEPDDIAALADLGLGDLLPSVANPSAATITGHYRGATISP